ncbi:hypothetical protein D9619_012707 [Psilocybe cf. subviscida]|uniref:F-box domain-containing protein n=1 Tax=Psilocybe cf. subviscida TaxID=2480587 RepID=A0A8H5AQP6_9AGAR|nr:hypothetical protein D9619_012707 [Psilocybe cf. subviscida]
MTQPGLPLEVLSHIIDDVNSKGDLCSMSLASRTLRDECQRALFRHTGILKIELPELAENKFLDSIIDSPHRLALLVRSFEAHLVWERPVEHQGCVIRDIEAFMQRNKSDPKNLDSIVKFIDKIERALVLMTNLKNLRILATGNKDLPETVLSLPHILRKCTFQLHDFYWEHVRSDGDLIISKFLSQQSALRSFELPLSRRQSGQQYARALRVYAAAGQLNLNLETLSGPAEMTVGLLNRADGKRSRTQYLRWTMGHPKRCGSADGLPHLSGILCNIRLFHVDYNPIGRDTSEYVPLDIFPFLDNLRVLRFSTGNIGGITQEHLDTLAKLPKLQVLVMVVQIGINFYEHDTVKTVAENLFSCCGSLEYIDIESFRINASTERLMRYISKRHGVPKNGEYSWDDRHQFVEIDENDK